MPAIDFPSSPTLNQTHTANGRTWRWDGSSWVSANALTASDVTGALTYTPENVANKGQNSGYAGLDASARLIVSQLPAFTGDATSTAGSAALTLANSGVGAGTYTKVTVDAKGRVTGGASLASADLPTYTGTLTSSQITTGLGYTPESVANKNAANGYAGLDASGKVASAQLPSFVDDVLEYANLAGFPGTGSSGVIYVAIDTNKVYRWSGSAYVEISPSPGTTDSLTEGAVNLYFTTARARSSISAGSGLTYNASTGAMSLGNDINAAVGGKFGFLTTNSYLFYNGSEIRVTNNNGASSLPVGAASLSRGSITGLTIANDATNPNTHITIATGQARDSTDSFDYFLTTGLVKRLDQPWAAGTNSGALDTGSVAANTGYWVFIIRKTSDGTLDALMSTSATNPTLPSGYGTFRRIGAVLTDSSGFIRKFTQHGDYFELYYRTADFAGVANGAGPYLRQMTCPKGIPLKLRVFAQSTGGSQLVTVTGVYDPALGVPQLSTLKRGQIRRTMYYQQDGQYGAYGIFDGDVWCDSNGQLYTHSDNSSDTLALGIYGWTDDRGQYV